jgi:hypothetical protein
MMGAPWQVSPGGHGIVKLWKLLPHGVALSPLSEVPLALATPLETVPPLPLGAPVTVSTPEDAPLITTKVLPEAASLATPALLPGANGVPPLAEPTVTPTLLLPLTVPRLV